MAFIRFCFIALVTILFAFNTNAQTVSYPPQSSLALKETAGDIAILLQKSITGSQFITSGYTSMPQTGIIFIYDSTITHNQACRVQSDGISFIKFSAPQDNGLIYGVYQYLQNLGFRFYLPGSLWEQIPSLSSVYKTTDTTYATNFKYNTWYISGGYRQWIMDNDAAYSWETYNGLNGHNWSLYQRRNRMMGQYGFQGHRSDIISGSSLSTWQNNPCYIASFNNSRVANSQSVPDVNNNSAKQLWASIIEQKYLSYRNTILNNPGLYTGQYRNYKYGNDNVGIEVPDGALWGNTTDNLGCGNSGYGKESDQNITLANFTAQSIGNQNPNLRFQLYAYSAHADVPSANIPISNKLDIQLIPAIYNNLTSTNGLRNRWFKRSNNISEYHYLNLSAWSGETTSFFLDDFKATVQIAKDKKSQGLVWETSPSKFASLPFLMAANNNLLDNVSVDNSLREFCNTMFAGAGNTIFKLLQTWTDSRSLTGIATVKYKIPLYIQMIADADLQTANEAPVVKNRLRELKAYLHYMLLYFNTVADQRSISAKAGKAGELCIYLAKTNKMQLVNSNYLIQVISRAYIDVPGFYTQYNNISGTAYLNGNLPLLTAAEIDNNFINDKAVYGSYIKDYRFESAEKITNEFDAAGINPLKKISIQINYTSGMDYYNRSEFFIQAPVAGSFTINYSPRFDMPNLGYINFLVESTDKALEIIEDFSIDQNAKEGTITIKLPAAGHYKLTVSSKYKSAVKLDIITNKNYFYKRNIFLGSNTDAYVPGGGSLPGYFYIPKGLQKVYFSIENSYAGGTGFASAEKINSSLSILDKRGNAVKAGFVNPNDSTLFYIEIPAENSGKFYRISTRGIYKLTFANISNMMWYAEPKPLPCNNAEFAITSLNKSGNCVTQITAVSKTGQLEWQVADQGKIYYYSHQSVIELPQYSSPDAVITLTNGTGCSVTRKLKDDANYLKTIQNCASGGANSEASVIPVLYPNPSTGNFKCMQDGAELTANQLLILNSLGIKVAIFSNISQFNISNLPAGQYWYKMTVKDQEFAGKILKL